MPTQQGSLDLLQHPVSQELLASKFPARFAYVWTDGTPRVIPIWFTWTGEQIVLGTPPAGPKVAALRMHPNVALTIDSSTPPYKVLMVRGSAHVEIVEGVPAEYAQAAERYYGVDVGRDWVKTVGSLTPTMARIAITPEWVGMLDFESRFPNAIETLMGL